MPSRRICRPLSMLIGIAVAALLTLVPHAVALAQQAQDRPAPLVGTVTLADSGAPATDVEVRLLFGLASETRRTDADGGYSFERVEPGKYTVRVLPPDDLHVVGEASVGIAIEDAPADAPRASRQVDFALVSAPALAVAPSAIPAASPAPVLVQAATAPATVAQAAVPALAVTQATAAAPAVAQVAAPAPTAAVVLSPAPAATASVAKPAGTPAQSAPATQAPPAAPPSTPSPSVSPSAVVLPTAATTGQPPPPQAATEPADRVVAPSPSGPDGVRPSPVPAPEAEPSLAASDPMEGDADDTTTGAETAALSPVLRPPPASAIGSPLAFPSPSTSEPPATGVTAESGPSATAMPPDAAPPVVAEVVAAPRRVVSSFAELRTDGPRTEAIDLRATTTDSLLLLGVPFRTQIDGSLFSLVNCGPASLAMVLTAFGLDVDPPSVRDYLNYLVGSYDADEGTSLYVLARIAREAGLTIFGAGGSGSLHGWTVEGVRQQVAAGRPVITLTKYRKLPGHLGSQTDFDHYIVITGLSGGDFVYNDAAYSTQYGQNLVITPSELEQAWASSSNPRHAVAIGLGDAIRALPVPPARPTTTVAGSSAQAQAQAETQALDVAEDPTAFPTPTRPPVRPPALERLRERLLEDLGARSAVIDETTPSGL